MNGIVNYRFLKTLGSGSFGEVVLAEDMMTGNNVAIKIIDSQHNEIEINREIQIMKVLGMHPNIIRLEEEIHTKNHTYIVMEYAENGDLLSYLLKQKNGRCQLSEGEARKIFRQIICGLNHCHGNMIVHRDLKLENVLLGSRCDVKIADFGLSKMLRYHRLRESVGSLPYAAPEVLSGKFYAFEADIWSCGVILYALLCGDFPFGQDIGPDELMKMEAGIYNLPEHLSFGAKDLIRKMLRFDQVDRITIPEILQHSWLQLQPQYLPPTLPTPISLAHTIQQSEQIAIKMGFKVLHLGMEELWC
ncbi:hypothetical protein SLE2022_375460 [Rubroshorea leprosula]